MRMGTDYWMVLWADASLAAAQREPQIKSDFSGNTSSSAGVDDLFSAFMGADQVLIVLFLWQSIAPNLHF